MLQRILKCLKFNLYRFFCVGYYKSNTFSNYPVHFEHSKLLIKNAFKRISSSNKELFWSVVKFRMSLNKITIYVLDIYNIYLFFFITP